MRFSNLSGIRKVKKNSAALNIAISSGVFIVVMVLFLLAISNASQTSMSQQKESLVNAVDRCLLQSYVTEGRYPQSFSALQQKYGIIYDDSKFRVDYICYGSNMRPDVTIIELGGTD